MTTANRYIPRYRLTVDPEIIVKHFDDISDYALNAETEEPMDVVYEMVPGTTRFTGKMLFVHAGHSALMGAYLKTLKDYYPA